MSQEFFDEIDIEGIVEGHAKEVVGLQESQAEKIAKAYGEIRRELQDRLSHARFDSFTAQRLRSVLAQIDSAIDAVNRSLHSTIEVGADHATRMGVEQLIKEVHRFDRIFTGAVRPVNLNVTKAALDTKDFLMNQYTTSLASYGAETKKNVARALSSAAIQELPYSQVVQKVGEYFTGQEWEVHRIARTELHHIYSVGKLNAMKQAEIPKKGLYHPMDSRTGQDSIELAEENPIIPVGEMFKQVYIPTLKNGKRGKAQYYEFMVPPNRPNDRAVLIPVRDEWL